MGQDDSIWTYLPYPPVRSQADMLAHVRVLLGRQARGTDLVNRYVMNLARATHVSLPLARTFNLVLQLVEPTSALLHPRTVARVLHTYRRSPALTGAAVEDPWVAPPR